MIREGISRENFEATREFLGKYANILLQTQDARLGYALDSKFYGIGEFGGYLQGELAKLTVEEVNRAIRKNLNLRDLRIVMITKDAEGLKQAIEKGLPSIMSYNSPKPPEVMAEDKEIEIYPVHARSVNIVPVTDIFH